MPATVTVRACFHCRHSVVDDGARMCCDSPDVQFAQNSKPVTVIEARDRFGACGYEARFLSIIGDTNHEQARTYP